MEDAQKSKKHVVVGGRTDWSDGIFFFRLCVISLIFICGRRLSFAFRAKSWVIVVGDWNLTSCWFYVRYAWE